MLHSPHLLSYLQQYMNPLFPSYPIPHVTFFHSPPPHSLFSQQLTNSSTSPNPDDPNVLALGILKQLEQLMQEDGH